MKTNKQPKINQKSAQKGISTAKFLLTIQSQLVGTIAKADNERAYQNKLIITTKNINQDSKKFMTDILNKIIDKNMSAKTQDLVSTERIFIDTADYNDLVFHIKNCLDHTVNVDKLNFRMVKEAIKTAYEVKMRIVR